MSVLHLRPGRILLATLGATLLSSDALADDTRVGALIFAHYHYDLSEEAPDNHRKGLHPSPNEFDIKRVYLDFKNKIDRNLSVRITTDVGRTNDRKFESFMKYAYLQAKLAEGIKVRVGSAGTPMVGFADKFWGQRWLAMSLTDQERVLSSSDLGVHALGTHSSGLFSWAAAVVNGEGYGNPETNTAKAAQARITLDPLHGDLKLPISVFASKDINVLDGEDEASTLVASVGFSHDAARVWGEYVTHTEGDVDASGISTNAVGNVQDLFNVVVRYDSWDPNTDADDDAHTIVRAGVTKDFAKKVSAGLIFEQTTQEADEDNPTKGLFVRMQAGF